MDSEHPVSRGVTRVPTRADLIRICSALNEAGARYVVLGGAAIIELGLMRTTNDLDLLVDPDMGNVDRVCAALSVLPDGAAREVRPGDVAEYVVVRINDEFTIDLMGAACGLTYRDAEPLIDWKDADGVRIPFASPMLLWKTKQPSREKDALDRSFLRKWFADHGQEPPADA